MNFDQAFEHLIAPGFHGELSQLTGVWPLRIAENLLEA